MTCSDRLFNEQSSVELREGRRLLPITGAGPLITCSPDSARAAGLPRLRLALEQGHGVITIHAGDEVERDFLRANGLAASGHRAATEAFGVHLVHHRLHALVAFGLALRHEAEVRNLGGDEESL